MKCDICGKESEILDCYTGFNINLCSECWCDKNLMSLVPELNRIYNDHRVLAIKVMRQARGLNDTK